MAGAGARAPPTKVRYAGEIAPYLRRATTPPAKALVFFNVISFVENGDATLREHRGGVLELTFVTGEVFRVGKTTETRIY
jgi:hypothetical protein